MDRDEIFSTFELINFIHTLKIRPCPVRSLGYEFVQTWATRAEKTMKRCVKKGGTERRHF